MRCGKNFTILSTPLYSVRHYRLRPAIPILETSLKGSSLLLIAWLAEKSEHILLVCLDARLVEWVNVNHVTADTASLLEEIEESSDVVLIDTLD